jgi:hypothetical protein
MKRHSHLTQLTVLTFLTLFTAALCGCSVLTYTSPDGEKFTRSSLGADTTISSLTVETNTNGVRRVDLRGYRNDHTQVLGTVTEAAVRAAIEGVTK